MGWVNIYILAGLGLAAAALYPLFTKKTADQICLKTVSGLMGLSGVLMLLGYFSQLELASGDVALSLPLSAPFIDAKLCGVLAMFGSIAILFVLPFMDTHPVRSARFRPWFKIGVLLLVLDVFLLTVCGAKPAEGLWVPTSQLAMLYYMGFFIVGIPFLSKFEPVRDLPESIHQSV